MLPVVLALSHGGDSIAGSTRSDLFSPSHSRRQRLDILGLDAFFEQSVLATAVSSAAFSFSLAFPGANAAIYQRRPPTKPRLDFDIAVPLWLMERLGHHSFLPAFLFSSSSVGPHFRGLFEFFFQLIMSLGGLSIPPHPSSAFGIVWKIHSLLMLL